MGAGEESRNPLQRPIDDDGVQRQPRGDVAKGFLPPQEAEDLDRKSVV